MAAQHHQQEAMCKKKWDTNLHRKYEEIDTKATQMMLVAEEKCMPKFQTMRNWSTEMREAGLKIRYFHRYKNYHEKRNISTESLVRQYHLANTKFEHLTKE